MNGIYVYNTSISIMLLEVRENVSIHKLLIVS